MLVRFRARCPSRSGTTRSRTRSCSKPPVRPTYISEAIDQTRGWFYTLHAVSTLLFDRPAFKNVICLGHDPGHPRARRCRSRAAIWSTRVELVEHYGADAMRWYMYASAPPVQPAPLRPRAGRRDAAPVHADAVEYLQLLRHVRQSGRLDAGRPRADGRAPAATAADRSLGALAAERAGPGRDGRCWSPTTCTRRRTRSSASSRSSRTGTCAATGAASGRRRTTPTRQAAYQTLYTCLTTLARLMAPFMPFVAEAMYHNLVVGPASAAGGEAPAPSVHLAAWPEYDAALIDDDLLADYGAAAEHDQPGAGGAAHRRAEGAPAAGRAVGARPTGAAEGLRRFEADLRDELNVKSIRYLDSSANLVEYRFKPNLRVVGRKHGRLVPALRGALEALAGPEAAAGRPGGAGGRLVLARRPGADPAPRSRRRADRGQLATRLRRGRGGRPAGGLEHHPHPGAGARGAGARPGANSCRMRVAGPGWPSPTGST